MGGNTPSAKRDARPLKRCFNQFPTNWPKSGPDSTMKLIRIETISSKPDTYGNCYHAMRVTNQISGKCLEFTISGDNGPQAAYELFQDWEAVREFCELQTTVLGVRDFNRETKGLAHGGCTGKEITKHISDNGGRPSFYEAVKAHCDENGIEIGSYYSDLHVPVSPSISRLAKAYQRDGALRSTFRDNITGKLTYDFPFCFEPFWEAKQKSVQATKESE